MTTALTTAPNAALPTTTTAQPPLIGLADCNNFYASLRGGLPSRLA